MRTRLLAVALTAVVALLMLLVPRRAEAYPWMIRHSYNGCAICHADPSGGGNLTTYGRAQGDLLLRTQYGSGESSEPSKTAGFLWGLVPLPEDDSVMLGGAFRGMVYRAKPEGGDASSRFIHMQSDFRANLKLENGLRAGASIGYLHEGGQDAWLTSRPEDNIVSREHWVGYGWGEESQMLLRAGRMNLPFGIRDIQHTLWARADTLTDINKYQQHGVAFFYGSDKVRAEVMGIAGNFQVKPDEFRERGYAGYFEYAPIEKTAIGVSSQVLHAKNDLLLGAEGTRMAHGLFARYSPVKPLVLMLEGDALFNMPKGADTAKGFAGYVQADVEVIQGVHLIGTGEMRNPGGQGSASSYGGWGSVAWFFAPHADVRFDFIEQSIGTPVGHTGLQILLAQLHFYL